MGDAPDASARMKVWQEHTKPCSPFACNQGLGHAHLGDKRRSHGQLYIKQSHTRQRSCLQLAAQGCQRRILKLQNEAFDHLRNALCTRDASADMCPLKRAGGNVAAVPPIIQDRSMQQQESGACAKDCSDIANSTAASGVADQPYWQRLHRATRPETRTQKLSTIAKATSGKQVFGLQGPYSKELPSEYMRRTCAHLDINPELLQSAATSKGRRRCQRDSMTCDATTNPNKHLGISTGSLSVYTHQLEAPMQKQDVADERPPFKQPRTRLPAKGVNLSTNATISFNEAASRHGCNVTVLARAVFHEQHLSAVSADLPRNHFSTGSQSPAESHELSRRNEALGYHDVQGCPGSSACGARAKAKSSEGNYLVTKSQEHSPSRTSSCQGPALCGDNVTHVLAGGSESRALGHMKAPTSDLEQLLLHACVLTDEDRAFYGCKKPKDAGPEIPSAQAVPPCIAADAQPLKHNSNLAPSAENDFCNHLPPWMQSAGEISEVFRAPSVAFGATQGTSDSELCGFCRAHPQNGCDDSSDEVAAASLRYRYPGLSEPSAEQLAWLQAVEAAAAAERLAGHEQAAAAAHTPAGKEATHGSELWKKMDRERRAGAALEQWFSRSGKGTPESLQPPQWQPSGLTSSTPRVADHKEENTVWSKLEAVQEFSMLQWDDASLHFSSPTTNIVP